MKRFTLRYNEFDLWLSVFQHAGLLIVKKDPINDERDVILLQFETTLIQNLLGRMNLPQVILILRILRAITPESGKPEDAVIEGLARRMLHGNKQLASWALQYAKLIHLVAVTKSESSSTSQNLISLTRNRIISILDQREPVVCKALVELVRNLSRPNLNDGWVDRQRLIQEMGLDPQFGYSRGEHEYWINQAVHKQKLLEMRTERYTKIYIRIPKQAPAQHT